MKHPRFLRRNKYRCDTCGGHIVTVDIDYGTTPMFLNCRWTPGCNGRMISSMYLTDQTEQPDFEWFKPVGKIKDRAMRQHVEMGGLDIRPIPEGKYYPSYHIPPDAAESEE